MATKWDVMGQNGNLYWDKWEYNGEIEYNRKSKRNFGYGNHRIMGKQETYSIKSWNLVTDMAREYYNCMG